MSTKKVYKIKKKNFIIFLLFIALFIFGIIEIVFCIGKLITTSNNKEEEKEIIVKEKKEKDKDINKDKRLDELENIDKKIDYFNYDYIDRYIKYKENNKNMNIEQIIKNVNMNLDKKQYEDKIPAKNLNKETILVNKYYYLDENYVPNNLEKINNQYALDNMKLVKEAKEAFEKLSKDASKENLNIIAMSSYRSYSYQIDLYNRYAKSDGKEKADTYSGRAGHSEHQTGLAVDVYNKKVPYTSFENTKEYEWMMKNAYKYGFILRFPKDKEEETGYHFESWHYRYVGIDIATYIKENNISFEEYYATKIKD